MRYARPPIRPRKKKKKMTTEEFVFERFSGIIMKCARFLKEPSESPYIINLKNTLVELCDHFGAPFSEAEDLKDPVIVALIYGHMRWCTQNVTTLSREEGEKEGISKAVELLIHVSDRWTHRTIQSAGQLERYKTKEEATEHCRVLLRRYPIPDTF